MAERLAETSDTPPAKRTKFDYEGLFSSFHSDLYNLARLSEARKWLDTEMVGLCLLKIFNCNGYLGVPFTDTFCDVRRNVEDPDVSKRKYFGFDTVFEHGFSVIDSYIENPANVPKRKGARIALQRLLDFFKYDLNDCRKALVSVNSEKLSETEWEVRLAHHLLSKLAVQQDYILDKVHRSGRGSNVLHCSCCKEKILGKYGDTSIGSTSVWHGYVDIMLGVNGIPVNVAHSDEPDSPVGNESSFEIKINENVNSFRQQMLAETIVFSFLQKKCNPDYDNFLIPTIGITRECVYLFFYDCENDILLESSPLKIFRQEEHLSLYTVLALWFAVNYKYFCSGVPSSMMDLNFKADFPKHTKSVQNVYLEDVSHGCGSGKSKVFPFNPMDFTLLSKEVSKHSHKIGKR